MTESSEPRSQAPSGSPAADGRGAAPEFVAWAADHERQQRLHDAGLAQITEHPDPGAAHDAIAQQEAWARRQEHEKRLHDSAIAQMKPHGTGG